MGSKEIIQNIDNITAIIQTNNLISDGELKQVSDVSDNKCIYFLELQKKYNDVMLDIRDLCIKENLFTSEGYLEIEQYCIDEVWNNKKTNEEQKKDQKEKVIPHDNSKNHISKVEKWEDGRYTEKYIKSLISEGKNLYSSIPGYMVPMIDNKFYAEIQLKRFIDSGWSDFIIETQKKEGLIYNMIKFKISWRHETQDQTPLRWINDKSKENVNLFFAQVRKYIGSSLSDMNSDMKHVVQDSGFSLDYLWKANDFRLSAIPTRVSATDIFPRYCIRLASDGDDIDFNKIELLPFMKEYYQNIIDNKKPWMIAITGPTGSGKTTMIYGILNELDKDVLAVLAIEKPIESRVHWVNQTQEDATERSDKWERYNNKLFMKGILRQSWDVIFVWEMRDAEETQQWVKTWLVWNKLITTFHTNSSVDTILRLREEWVTNNAIGNGVREITAQRLLQKVCPNCSVEPREKEKIEKKIYKSFNRSRLYFRSQFREIISWVNEEIFNDIERLEITIRDNMSFISEKDIDDMMEILEENLENYLNQKTKEEKINFMLNLFDKFPNPNLRTWIDHQIKNSNIKEANAKWCSKCTDGYLKDRIVIVEWLTIDKPIKRFIQDPESKLIDLEKFLLDKWFINMRMYGYLLAVQWITTIEKIDEVVD